MPNEMNDIVVVDDNCVLLSVLCEIFKEHGYTVRTATDGFEALAAIRDRVPDILLSDLNMPGMSGFELLSVVRRRFPTIAVIAMSGDHAAITVSPGIAADGFYAKGSNSVDGLLSLLSQVQEGEPLESRRAAAPIWIPGLPIHPGDLSTTAVACPECMRVFSHSLRDSVSAQPREIHCPHCFGAVRLAVVRQAEAMDRTSLSLPTAGRWIGAVA